MPLLPIVPVQRVIGVGFGFAVVAGGTAENETVVPAWGTAAPVKGSVRVAVKLTGELTLAGLGKDATLATGVALLITCATVFDVPLLKFEFELTKAALIEWTPAEENKAGQGETTPPVNMTGEAVVPKVQLRIGVPPSE